MTKKEKEINFIRRKIYIPSKTKIRNMGRYEGKKWAREIRLRRANILCTNLFYIHIVLTQEIPIFITTYAYEYDEVNYELIRNNFVFSQ